MNLEIRHPPWPTITGREAVAGLMLMKSFNQVVAMANIEATRGQALENVDVVRQNGRSWTGYGGYGI